ncbi:MAG: hypothetical protein IPJ15_13995 [Actinomycetales bacterium]|nr:hypothetical protein [Candidatus Phosphoribacter baldrii]MBK6955648.1 hypothetical protein [Candidatus Phosphoribacter baldrii]MBK7612293.1 hypothetical protein [Candidatus Phosphoribacter baldrii]HRC12503.1 hypothetical protein [Dermatophilaceae bacterium]
MSQGTAWVRSPFLSVRGPTVPGGRLPPGTAAYSFVTTVDCDGETRG